jgi:ribonuclease P/MRP protein subunit POP7
MSTTKRVRSYLGAIEKRRGRGQKGPAVAGGNDASSGRWRGQGKVVEGGAGEVAVVLVKATGKAIDNALRVALFFTAQDGYSVRLGTGSVGAVDDIVVPSPMDAGGDDGSREEVGGVEGRGRGGDGTPETRVRRTSMLEVAIQLK